MKLRIVLLCLAALVLFAALAFYFTADDPLFDFTAFWIAGNLTLKGQDPYRISDWITVYSQYETLGLTDNQTFLYPKPILPLLIPFGALSLETASFIWLMLSQIAVLAALLLLAGFWEVEKPVRYLVPFLIGVFIYRPYLLTLNLGQLGGFFLLLMVGALLLWEKQRWLAGGLLFSLLALKPSLGFPIMVLVSVWFLINKKWGYFVGMGIGGIALLLIGWLFDPYWVQRFLDIGAAKVSDTFGFHPTYWGLTGYLCDHNQTCVLFAGGLAASLVLGGFLWFVWYYRQRLSLPEFYSISISLAILMAPYLWAYDHLLLVIPLAGVVGSLIRKGYPYLVTVLVPLVLSLVSMFFLNVAVTLDNDTWSAMVPSFLLILVVICVLMPTREKQPASSGVPSP